MSTPASKPDHIVRMDERRMSRMRELEMYGLRPEKGTYAGQIVFSAGEAEKLLRLLRKGAKIGLFR